MVVCSDTNNRDILLLPFASYQGVFEPPPPWCLQLKTDAKSFFSVPLKWPVVVQCHLEEKLLEWEWLVTIGALCQAHDRTVRGLLVTLLGRRAAIWQVLPLLKVPAPRQWSQMSSCHFVRALCAPGSVKWHWSRSRSSLFDLLGVVPSVTQPFIAEMCQHAPGPYGFRLE